MTASIIANMSQSSFLILTSPVFRSRFFPIRSMFTRNSVLRNSISLLTYTAFCFVSKKNTAYAENINTGLPSTYESQSGCQKQEYLWEQKIKPSTHSSLPEFEDIKLWKLITSSYTTKMTLQSDEAPQNWVKAIHAQGTVSKVRFISEPNSPFSGLFKGDVCGLIRLSVTADPKKRGFTPGLALKLFVDNFPSKNVSALFQLTGQGNNYNFMANELSNIVPESDSFGAKFVNLLFSRVSAFPRAMLIKKFASVQPNGTEVQQPIFPLRLFFVPNSKLGFSELEHDFRVDFAKLPKDTLLYDVFAVEPKKSLTVIDHEDIEETLTPEHRKDAIRMAQIVTTSEFLSSSYGDTQLFFAHEAVDEK